MIKMISIKTDLTTIDKIQSRMSVFSQPEDPDIIIDLANAECLRNISFLEEVLGQMIDDEYDYLLITI
ncbi:MAG: hypothetical protein WC119_00720 [Synergistaceae bacterium]